MASPLEPVELPVVGIVLNVLSNLAFLLPLLRALRLGDALRAYHAAHIVVWSSLWHLCAPTNGICLLSRAAHQGGDYVGALLLPFSLLLALVPFGPVRPVASHALYTKPRRDLRYVELWLYLAAITALIMAGASRGGFWPLPWAVYAGIMSVALVTVLVSWLTLWRRYGHPPSYDRTDLVISLFLGSIGLVLFLYVEDYLLPGYLTWTTHALWHVLAAIAFFYALEERSRTNSGLAQFHAWPPTLPRPPTDDPYERQDPPIVFSSMMVGDASTSTVRDRSVFSTQSAASVASVAYPIPIRYDDSSSTSSSSSSGNMEHGSV